MNDLCDQNQILVRTVEDLEAEANDKLAVLQAKTGSSDQAITVSLFKFLFHLLNFGWFMSFSLLLGVVTGGSTHHTTVLFMEVWNGSNIKHI